MPRAERLLELAALLRGRDATAVSDLAAELGVSRRTLLRDLASLRARGMPISGEAGHGGGIRLEADRGLSAIHLSLDEVAALWLGARLSRAASDLPWSAASATALAKLLGSLPKAKARALRSLCSRVVVGCPASEAIRAQAGSGPPELLRLFEQAFSGGRVLGFEYIDRERRQTQRRVEPHGLLVQTPVWYVLAFDLEKREPRMFRMDRVSRPRLLAQAFRPRAEVVRALLPPELDWRPLTGKWQP
jgi:predicted DNA-binding transcriptional regulator YafY